MCVCTGLGLFVQQLQLPEQLFCLNHRCPHEGDALLLLGEPRQHLVQLHAHTAMKKKGLNLRSERETDSRASSDLLEADFVLQQLQVLLQLQVVFLKEAIERLLHVSELGQ